jgi:uncharacterized membrane protein (UPF0127 family)
VVASRYRRFLNATRGNVLADKAFMADSFFLRLRGLLGRPQLANGQGLFLDHCNCIHMFGMTYAIDAVFLDKQLCVVGLVTAIGPGRVSSVYKSANACLELPAGTIAATGTALGDNLQLQ